jgi:pimeloyl-ACP methyl ester carboxylesterase
MPRSPPVDGFSLTSGDGYSAAAQARSVVGLVQELGLGPVVIAGYDIGSRIAQTIARSTPQLCERSCSHRRSPAAAIGS